MNGFDEETWARVLQDPRVSGEGAYLGPDAGDPLPWQHDDVDPQAVGAVTEDSVGDLYYPLPLPAPGHPPGWVDVVGNLPEPGGGM